MSRELKYSESVIKDGKYVDVTREDEEVFEKIFDLLTGRNTHGASFGRGHNPKMSDKKARSVLWALQEVVRILPDNIECCSNCGRFYDSWIGGLYWESKGKHFCDGCIYLVPENYDRGKR